MKLLVVIVMVGTLVKSISRERYDYMDRVCDNFKCFHEMLVTNGGYKDCTYDPKDKCTGKNGACKVIGNSNMAMCVDPKDLEIDPNLPRHEDDVLLIKEVMKNAVSAGSNKLCLFDKDENMYDVLCRRMNGTCHKASKKCGYSTYEAGKFADVSIENTIKNLPYRYKLPWDYTDKILLIIDGTGTQQEFEVNQTDATKDGSYSVKQGAYRRNGNWENHLSNIYEDFLGVKYYWYGPVHNDPKKAEAEVESVTPAVVDTICEFMYNVSKSTRDSCKTPHVSLLGYSRGGYTAMEVALKLKDKGCTFTNGKPVTIDFLGLFDPVSSTLEKESLSVIKLTASMIAGKDRSLPMPDNAKHLAVAYGAPSLCSRPFFTTLDAEPQPFWQTGKGFRRARQYFYTTHGGIGGTPGDSDFCMDMYLLSKLPRREVPEYRTWSGVGLMGVYNFYWATGNSGCGKPPKNDYDIQMERSESMRADKFMRKEAIDAGMNILPVKDDYYDFRIVRTEDRPFDNCCWQGCPN